MSAGRLSREKRHRDQPILIPRPMATITITPSAAGAPVDADLISADRTGHPRDHGRREDDAHVEPVRVRSDQLELAGPADGLAAVLRGEFAVDVPQVRLYRVDGDVHLGGDLGRVQHA